MAANRFWFCFYTHSPSFHNLPRPISQLSLHTPVSRGKSRPTFAGSYHQKMGSGGIEKSHSCKWAKWIQWHALPHIQQSTQQRNKGHYPNLHGWDFSIPPSPKNVWISNFCEKKLGRRSLAVFSHNLLCRKHFNCKLIYCETANEGSKRLIRWKQTRKCCKQTFSCLVTPEMAFTTGQFHGGVSSKTTRLTTCFVHTQ